MRQPKYIPHYTVADYQQWEGDWELIDGVPSAMSPSPTSKHQRLARILSRKLEDALQKIKEKCGQCELFYELDWIVNDTTVVRPDIVITCDRVEDYITTPPVLIVEILSPSSAHKDRLVKMDIYQEYGVKYYLVADPENSSYATYELVNGRYRERVNLRSFAVTDGCSIELDVEVVLGEAKE
jgi:Uma2 family endonuclease